MSTEPPAPTRGMVIRGSCDVNGDLGFLLGRDEVPQWRRHFVGDREFWRWTGKNPETGQWYTQEEKDASIAFDAPDETVSPDKDEGKSPGDTAWFETHWSRNPAAANVETEWRRHFVGDREFWRLTGKNPETGQWYTQAQKDASIRFDAPGNVVLPDKNEGISPHDTYWFETQWALKLP